MRRLGALSLSLGAVLLAAAGARAQIVTVQDFEGPLPGVQGYPAEGGYTYSGGANGSLTSFQTQVTDQDAAGGVQSFRVDIDATNQIGTWGWYGGFGGFHGYYGEGFGFAEGQEGQNTPANYRMTFDMKVLGNNGAQGATPVGGAVGLYKADYETVYNVDVNNDGDMADGFDIWHSTFTASAGDNNWNHVVWELDAGTPPTTNGSPVTTPVFDDASTVFYQIYFNNGGFNIDADNAILVDNVAFEFIPPTATPGDFDGDGDVDGRDFLTWQRDTGVGSLVDWKANYGMGSALATFSAVPEPGSLLLAMAALAIAGCRRTC